MLIVKSWIEELVGKTIADAKLADLLGRAGIEVESIEHVGDLDPKIVVARIKAIKTHPNADRLSLITLDLGKSTIQIVTGAPNLKTGLKVPFAPVGAKLLDGTIIKSANFRGIDSPGMACSAIELG